VNGGVDPACLFDAGLYNPKTKSNDVQRWLQAEVYEDGHHHHGDGRGHDHHHDVNRHDDRIRATCLTFDVPLQPQAFERWLDILIMFKGPNILRVKGIINLVGETRPVVVHGVQHIFHPPVLLDTWPSEDRRTRLIFITRDVSEEDLRGTLALLINGIERYELQGYVEDLLNDRIPPNVPTEARP
jgi:G3E family GTPase